MALKLGELVAILKTDNRLLDKGLDDGRRKAKAAGAGMEADARVTGEGVARELGAGGSRGGERLAAEASGRLRDARGRFLTAGADAGEQFVRGADGRLRDGRGRFVGSGNALGDAASQGVTGGLRGAMSAVIGFGSTLGQIAGPLGTTAGALMAIGSAAAFAAPLVGVLGGALGALPGLMAGLGAVTGVLGLGFMGLGDQFKKVSGSGGGSAAAVADKTYQIVQAQRRLRDANEEVIESQRELTKARDKAVETLADIAKAEEEAKERAEDLSRALTGAKLDEEEAALRVVEAQKKYQLALRQPWDPEGIKAAELAIRQSEHALEDARDRTGDLAKEDADAKKKGVQGSDEVKAANERHQAALDAVVAARKRERAAVEGVQDAEHALAEARKPAAGGGGGGGAAKEMMKLAPSAQAAVDAIKSLKPAFESLRLDVQEKLFKGVGDRIKEIAKVWFPVLHEQLGGMAETINGLFHTFATSITKQSFIDDISASLETFDGLIGRVGGALAGPFVDAFGRLARAAGPFITVLGDELGSLIEDFSTWIKKADESGKLEKFFKSAAESLHQIFTIGRTVGAIIIKIMSAIYDSGKGKNPLESFQGFLDKILGWLSNPENQKKITDFFLDLNRWMDQAMALMVALGPVVRWLFAAFQSGAQVGAMWMAIFRIAIDKVGDAIAWVGKNAPKWWNAVKDAAGKAKDWVVSKWNSIISWFSGMPNRIGRAASGMWDGIKNGFRSAINWIIGKWNGLSFGIPQMTVFGQTFGGGRTYVPQIPYLAQGGIVPATRGGRLVGVGEGGQDEAVIPLNRLKDMIGPTVIEIRSSGNEVDDMLLEILRGAVKSRGGNVQVVVGQS